MMISEPPHRAGLVTQIEGCPQFLAQALLQLWERGPELVKRSLQSLHRILDGFACGCLRGERLEGRAY